MNPGLAFGTGHHETTKLMLSRMQELDLVNSQILDLGTGSGILSIGAASLGAKKIIAIDIDSNAVRATEFNWTQNSFPQKIDFQILQGSFDHVDIFPPEYDLVLANITFAVISMNIEYLKNLKAKKFLFSGLIIEKKEDSINLFETHLGGKLNYFEQFNDWILIEWIR
jgi:ribosomal protein L11 methyltransferase